MGGQSKKILSGGGSQKDKVGGQFDFFFKSGGAVEKVPPHCHPTWETLQCKNIVKVRVDKITIIVVLVSGVDNPKLEE